ncbi:MAG: DUF3846 domain-containing protein [Clostridia bacterium]|nr:DUF3846 domain-containing protein [Clostridia bacterium]
MEKITVMVKEPGKDARLERIEPTLEVFRKLVNGHLEGVRVKDNVYMYIDEDGKHNGKKPNFRWRYGDTIVGTAVFLAIDDSGEEISLTDEQIKAVELELELRKLVSTPFFQVVVII